MSQARFAIGEKHIFIFAKILMEEGRQSHKLINRPYLPWLDKGVVLDLFELESLEEKDVPVEYSDTATSTGYILKDDKGNIWHNQYPHASFGQVSDKANWIATRNLKSRQEYDAALAENASVTGVSIKSYVTELAFAIYTLQEEQPKHSELLQKHLDDVKALFREKFNAELTFGQQIEGQHILESYATVNIVPLAA